MRKDVVLAVAVLSVLAGLLTVGYAQTRTEDESPDPFELRREAIDRIEAAYTENDIQKLETMVEVGDFQDAIEAKKQELGVAGLEELGSRKEDDEPAVVQEPIIDAIIAVLVCDSRYNRRLHRCMSEQFFCERNARRANRVRSSGKDRRQFQEVKLSHALQACENRSLTCQLRAAERRSTCYWLASLIPG